MFISTSVKLLYIYTSMCKMVKHKWDLCLLHLYGHKGDSQLNIISCHFQNLCFSLEIAIQVIQVGMALECFSRSTFSAKLLSAKYSFRNLRDFASISGYLRPLNFNQLQAEIVRSFILPLTCRGIAICHFGSGSKIPFCCRIGWVFWSRQSSPHRFAFEID